MGTKIKLKLVGLLTTIAKVSLPATDGSLVAVGHFIYYV